MSRATGPTLFFALSRAISVFQDNDQLKPDHSKSLVPIALLYALVVLIWGTTWVVIPYQLGVVAEELSVAYRFALSSLLLFTYSRLTRCPIGIPRKIYATVILMGALLFSVNYLFVYYGANYLSSGLIAVLFSLIVIFNAGFESLFFGKRFERRLQIASIVGIGGIALIFWPELANFDFEGRTAIGLAWILLAVVIAALANMTAIINIRTGLSLVVINAHAMGWGALTSIAIAAFLGKPFNFLFTPDYLWSLLYLAIFGSAIAFGCYLALLKKIGAARASFSTVLFPIVALAMSTLLEGYQWTLSAMIGVAMTLVGSWLALTRISTYPKTSIEGK